MAKKAYGLPYPPHWSEELDQASGALYFYHALRDESSWQHPLTETFREVIGQVLQLEDDKRLQFIGAYRSLEMSLSIYYMRYILI